MGKRVADNETIDPVRSRLAASAAAASSLRTNAIQLESHELIEGQGDRNSTPRRPPAKSAARDRLTVNRKVMFTEDEAERNADTATLVTRAFGSKATYSQITRAMWSVLAGAEDAIKTAGKRPRHLSVPSKGDHIAMAEYEDALAEFLIAALRRS